MDIAAEYGVEDNDSDDIEMGDVMEEDSSNSTSSTHSGDEVSKITTVPLWDKTDKTYRCTSCFWEVVDGLCQVCCQRFGEYGGNDDEPVRMLLW